jgi:hypothetical protein
MNSIITEDQSPVTEEDIGFLIRHTKSEKLPIIVAVKGKMPVSSTGKSGCSKASFSHFDSIIGFGFAETYCYGINGTRFGRSRFTVNLQFYVHPEYLRKRVGQSLLDRLIQLMSHSYG